MLAKANLLLLLSLLLLFFLWKETQGGCSSCPNNECSQTGMAEGKCFNARHNKTAYQSSRYTTIYYQGTSQGSSDHECGGWFGWRRCTRYYIIYHKRSKSSVHYAMSYHHSLICDAYCCTGYKKTINGNCETLEAPSQVIGVSLSKHLRRGRPILLVTWTAPQSDVTITWYRIQYKRSGTLFWGSQATITGSPPSTTHVLISLEPGTNYTVRMRAESALGAGVWSEEQIERTFGRPSRVTHVTLTVISGTTALRVTWAIPQSDLAISQYQVQYRISGTPSWSSAPPLSGSPPATSTALNGLNAGSEYNVRVRAMSAVGAGIWSAEQTKRIGTRFGSCDEPETPDNGHKVYTGILEGDKVRYFCNRGFKLSGEVIRECERSGQWSGIQPECNRYCDSPETPANGDRTDTGNLEGDAVTYFCNSGFNLSGNATRTCLSNGQWSGTQPNCNRSCDEPETPDNGQKVYTGILEGDMVTFFCNRGFKLSGAANRTCQSNGQWSGTQPECNLQGGWSSWTEESSCSVTCGRGIQVMKRVCNRRKRCKGRKFKVVTCEYCPCNGGWSQWSPGPCSQTCGNGTRTNTRKCTTHNDLDCCPGDNTTTETCHERNCHDAAIVGGWSSWNEIVPCSATCGGGIRFMVRKCNSPSPANGGRVCAGESSKTDRCGDCPCDAGWASWVSGACSGSCGQKGTAVATRKCSHSSQCCPGEATRIENCTNAPCD